MDSAFFQDFPDQSSLWIYGFAHPLEADARLKLYQAWDDFFPHWDAHGKPVRGAHAIFEDRFFLVAGFCETGMSGCAIDSSQSVMINLKIREGIDGMDRNLVFYRQESSIRCTDRLKFSTLLKNGTLGPKTRVFDLTVPNLGELRENGFEKDLSDSWHARAFLPKR